MRVAIQMDPLPRLNAATDATLLLAREALRRRYKVWHYAPRDLAWRDGKVIAHARPLDAGLNPGKLLTLDLKTMDVVWLRQNPPFDMRYLTTTYLLETLHPKPFVVNHPSHVRDYPEKLFPLAFKKFMPPTLISAGIDDIRAFRKEHKDIVVKPLYGFGGRSVFRIRPDDANFTPLLESLLSEEMPCMVQPFLPQMKNKEHRLILIDGELAATAARIPAKGEASASFLHGARYVKAKPTKRHLEICEAVGPILKKKEIIFAGLDVIDPWLTEINITSPGSLVGFNKLYGTRLERDIWDAVEARL